MPTGTEIALPGVSKGELAQYNRRGIYPIFGDGTLGLPCEYDSTQGVLKAKFVGDVLPVTETVALWTEEGYKKYRVTDFEG
jgi:hypothetical protein